MRVVILQPSYVPWLGYFDQLYKSDVFVIYDDVQFDKHGWRNRNRIKTAKGPQWLTVPVLTHGLGKPTNRDVRITPNDPWRRKHLQALRTHYAKAPAFADVFPPIEDWLSKEWEYLWELDLAGLRLVCDMLGLRREIRLSSEMRVDGEQTERLVRICQALGATAYLSGDAARAYLDETLFAAAGIRLEYHGYHHPTYAQLYADFISHLSIIDLLMNHGARSLEILVDRSVGAPEGHRP
jgi:hypothetical protein